ncbi:hypothetical protein ACFQRB_12650 [Halobaculum litoreum]|uniref:Uncharacterized protein n=1 Tax=Halobaculum litoreum TaxID=3031998 RepID=A0ABD5XYE1_9EURY
MRSPVPADADPRGRVPWTAADVDPTDADAWAVQLCGQDVA